MRLIILFSVLFPLSTEAYQLQPLHSKVNLRSAHRETYRIDEFSSNRAPYQQSTKLNMAPSDGDVASTSSTNSLITNVLNILGASTSILVAGTFFVVLALQRDALMVSFFMGAITNGALSKVLKKILNQDRPDDTSVAIEKPSDKGMPSSHAMSLGFIGTFTMLTLEWTQFIIPFYVAICLCYRVQSRLHTVEQVAVGMAFGVSNGFMWRHLVDGRNPLGINVMDFVTTHFLNDQGILPTPLLVVPALAGAVVVGSLERKLSKFVKKKNSE
jgi:hypothetical protein